MQFFLVDTETTGFDKPEVVEICLMRLTDYGAKPVAPQSGDFRKLELHGGEYLPVVVERFMPNKAIEEGASQVTGIFMEDLIDKRNTREVLSVFPDCKDDEICLIGHHIAYDVEAISNSIGRKFNPNIICTKRLAYHFSQNLENYKLISLAKEMVGESMEGFIKNAHAADSDVAMTYFLLKKLIKKLDDKINVIDNHQLTALMELQSMLEPLKYEDFKKRKPSKYK